jgi:hypothetical protein
MTRARNDGLLAAGAVAAIALWVTGLVLRDGSGHTIPDNAGDQRVLAWVHADRGHIELGCWLFMLGCLCLIGYAALLRDRMARYEGGTTTLASVLFGGALITALASARSRQRPPAASAS